jgi:hypothetical protein
MNLLQIPSASDVAKHRPSIGSLVLANAMPLLGVLFLGWDAFAIAFVYWSENVVIGVLNAVKIVLCSPDADEIKGGVLNEWINQAKARGASAKDIAESTEQIENQLQGGPIATHAAKLFLVPFFCFHYGLFCLVHGVFVCVLLGGGGPFAGGGPVDPFETAMQALQDPWLLLSIALLAASHVWSFLVNYVWGGEYRRTVPILLMFQPYGRIVVLHIAILAGGFAAAFLGSPVWFLVPLVIGKTLLDVNLHIWQHRHTDTTVDRSLTTALDDTLFGDN